ncbi:hypothetical protein [Nostoc sp. C052]|nr:hypothetical protein [Nostoc sp. C052]
MSPHFLKQEHDIVFHFGCVDTKATLWFSGWGVNREDGIIHQRPIS